MSSLLGRCWNGFWFPQMSPYRLAVCRVLVGSWLLIYAWLRPVAPWGEVPVEFYFPKFPVTWFYLSVWPTPVLQVIDVCWWLSLLMLAAGLLTNFSGMLATILSFYCLTIPNQFGKIEHETCLVPILLFILACSKCGDVFSIDAWWKKRRENQDSSPSQAELSAAYGWPIKLVQVQMVLIYFAAGVAKLREVGLEWVFSDNFRDLLLFHHYQRPMPVETTWVLFATHHGWMYQTLAFGALAIELLIPLALFSKWAARVLIPILGSMMIGIHFLMGFTFFPHLSLIAFWIPWERWVKGEKVDTINTNIIT